jgi:hypothetical protein
MNEFEYRARRPMSGTEYLAAVEKGRQREEMSAKQRERLHLAIGVAAGAAFMVGVYEVILSMYGL